MLRWKLAAALAGAVLAVSAGCASTSAGGGATNPGATASVESASTAATTVVVNKSVWYAGMKMTFGSAVSSAGHDGAPSEVSVDVVFDNLGPDNHNSANLRTTLTIDGAAYSGVVENAPMLPGSAKSKANVVFQTDKPVRNLSSGTITVGDGAQVQATLPLGPDGELVDLAPKTLVSGPKVLTFSELKVTISSCELRADYPERGEQAKKSKRLVVCGFAAHNLTNGFFHVYNQEFQLKAADGITSSAAYGTMQEVGIDGGATHEASLAWEIPWPVGQTYVLAVAWLGGQGTAKPTAQNTTEIALPLT